MENRPLPSAIRVGTNCHPEEAGLRVGRTFLSARMDGYPVEEASRQSKCPRTRSSTKTLCDTYHRENGRFFDSAQNDTLTVRRARVGHVPAVIQRRPARDAGETYPLHVLPTVISGRLALSLRSLSLSKREGCAGRRRIYCSIRSTASVSLSV